LIANVALMSDSHRDRTSIRAVVIAFLRVGMDDLFRRGMG
jgi:hypothetical protein